MLYVEIDSRKLDLALRVFPRNLKGHLGDAFDYIGRSFVKRLKAERLSGRPGLRASWVFTKRLQRTFFVPIGGIGDMGTEIKFDSAVAVEHEEGGDITAKGGGRLAVPLSMRQEMFTAKGALKKKYKAPGLLKNMRLVMLKGQPYLAKFQKRKSEEITPMYVLKRTVRIPARLEFFKTWDKQENKNIQRLNRAIQMTLNGVPAPGFKGS